MRAFLITFILSCLYASAFSQEKNVKSQEYTWRNVQISGAGFVSGIVFHPTEENLRYCRTDMGGAYRWDEIEQKWIPLLDWLSYEDVNLMGVESIALDPSNPDMVYLACGTYTNSGSPNGAILKSTDRGKTFRRIDVPFKFGANENGRGNGERMALDPNNPDMVYLGTRHNGLWKSVDQGIHWSQVTSFPDIYEATPDTFQHDYAKRRWEWANKGSGIISVVFDPTTKLGSDGSADIYVAVSLMNSDNLFKSSDYGKTWIPVPNQPIHLRPNHMVYASNGYLYLSYGNNPGPRRMTKGEVWKYNINNGEWADITPERATEQYPMGYGAVAVSAQNPNVVIASSFYRSEKLGGEELFKSTDGGNTWKTVIGNGGRFDFSKAPYAQKTNIHWLFDIEINPLNPDHAMFTTGFGGYETFNFTNVEKDKPTVWSAYSTGIEESVALELLSPPQGAHLISAIGDYGGFVHWDLDKPAPEGNFDNPHFGNTDGVACADLKPEIMVRVGVESGHWQNGNNIGYSLDGGKTWSPTPNMPTNDSRHGYICVSANGDTWIWTPARKKPYCTKDRGQTWIEIASLPENTRVIADKVDNSSFYAIDLLGGKFFVSNDAGATFTESKLNLSHPLKQADLKNRGDGRGGQDRIYATPGYKGDLWLAAFDGLYRAPSEHKFDRLPMVEEIHAFGFGKAAPGAKYPSIYLVGVMKGQRGIFRSDDKAKTWIRINDDDHQWGMILHVTGDPKSYGRVYVGTHGRGVVYGDPSPDAE